MAFLSLIAPYNPLALFFFFDYDKMMYLEHLQGLTSRLRAGSWGQTSLALVCRFIFQHLLRSLYIFRIFLNSPYRLDANLSSFTYMLSFQPFPMNFLRSFRQPICIDHGGLTLYLHLLIYN